MTLTSKTLTTLSIIPKWLVKNWQLASVICGLTIGVTGVWLAVRTSPHQELSYRVVRRFIEVFSTEENPRLLVLARLSDPDPNNTQQCSTEDSIGDKYLTLEGYSWHVCKDSLDAFEIEIINSGFRPIWYEPTSDRPEKAKPFYVQTRPPVKVLDAQVITAQAKVNGFEVVEDDQWSRGRVQCKWRRLASGESVIVRIVHERPEDQLEVLLTGEIRQCLAPIRLKSPKIHAEMSAPVSSSLRQSVNSV
jgi:hypothetical protein